MTMIHSFLMDYYHDLIVLRHPFDMLKRSIYSSVLLKSQIEEEEEYIQLVLNESMLCI
jgi:hypothetical protein